MAKRSKKKKAAPRAEIPAQPFRLSGDWLWGLVLVAAVVLVYSPVCWAGFVWDDKEIVTANPAIIGPLGLKEIWTTTAADICPFTITTFWLEHALWGLAPLPYHLVNVFLHAGCAVLLWRVLRSLQVPGAWLGAALWALHPVQVESAAWISEMKNTESGLFFLLAILFFVNWLRVRNGWNYGLTLLFSALAMASKSSTVILPMVLCLCAWWMEGRWQWRSVAKTAPIFLMSIITGAISMWTQKAEGSEDPHWLRSWPERLVTAGDAVWFYLGKLLWPDPLMIVYPKWRVDAGQWFAYLPLLAVIVLLFVLWLKRASWSRPWFFIFAYFLVALFPVLGGVNLTFFRYSFVADHFQYLAGMGPLALAGAGLVRLADFAKPRQLWLPWVFGAGIALIFGTISWLHAWVYESDGTLWSDTVAKNPDCWVGQSELGITLFDRGQVTQAIVHYQEALRINPGYAEAHNNLGAALLQEGQLDAGMGQLQKALQLKPEFAEAQNDLGIALFEKGKVDEAIVHYQKALEIDPDYADAQNDLGSALLKKGQVDLALAHLQKAQALKPGAAVIHYNLGQALSQKNRVNDAVIEYRKALELSPRYPEVHNALGIVYAQTGRMEDAIEQFQQALQLQPDDRLIQQNLARAQALARQPANR